MALETLLDFALLVEGFRTAIGEYDLERDEVLACKAALHLVGFLDAVVELAGEAELFDIDDLER